VSPVHDHAEPRDAPQFEQESSSFFWITDEMQKPHAGDGIEGAVRERQARAVRAQKRCARMLLARNCEHLWSEVYAGRAQAEIAPQGGEAPGSARKVEQTPRSFLRCLGERAQRAPQSACFPRIARPADGSVPTLVVVRRDRAVAIDLQLRGARRFLIHPRERTLEAMPGHDLPPLPPRPRDAHKASMGRVLLIAGSRGMAGAAALAAEAALRGGAGYVVICCPGSITPELTAAVPSAILKPCGGPDQEKLGVADLAVMTRECASAQSVVVGPGLGAGARSWLPAFLRACKSLPLVLDADALNALAELGRLALAELPTDAVLTPHPGEAARLLEWSEGGERVQADRAAALTALCAQTPAVVVLKGADTLVGARDRASWRNPTGNPGLATAGSGDVLSGLLGALLARGMTAWDAARLAAWLHGRAADLIAERVGEDALIASDLARAFGAAFLEHAALCGVGAKAC